MPELKATIEANLIAERVAIKSYSQIIALIGEKDSIPRRLHEGIRPSVTSEMPSASLFPLSRAL